eukprot:6458704-Amphidinium_carterae.1
MHDNLNSELHASDVCIISWNLCGLARELDPWSAWDGQAQILLLQETHQSAADDIEILESSQGTSYLGGRQHRKCAVSVCPQLAEHVTAKHQGNAFVSVDLQPTPRHKLLRLVSAHLPHAGHGGDYFTECIEELHAHLQEAHDLHAQLVLGCDSNVQLPPQPDMEPYVGTVVPKVALDDDADQARAFQWLSLVVAAELTLFNTFAPCEPYTHTAWNGGSQQIDFIGSTWTRGAAQIRPAPANSKSDHWPIQLTLFQFQPRRTRSAP